MPEQDDELVKKMKSEIEWLKEEKELRRLENERLKAALELESQEEQSDDLQKQLFKPHPIFNASNVRFFILLIIVAIIFFPIFKSLVYYGIDKYESKNRDTQRMTVLTRISTKFTEFNVQYNLYPFVIVDGTSVKVFSESIKNQKGEVLVPGQILDKFDIKDFGFESVSLGRAGCETEAKTTDPKAIWICVDSRTNEIGTILEISDQVPYLMPL